MNQKIDLGYSLLSINNRIIGAVDNLTIDIEEAELKEIEELMQARIITFIRPGKASTPTIKGEF